MRAEEDGGDHGGRFVLDWLIFTRRQDADGVAPTYLERFLAAPATGTALTQEQRDLLADWRTSRRGIFQVLAVFPGVSLVLKEIYTEETTEVADSWVSSQYNLWPGDLLYARPLKVKPFDRLAPGTLLLNPEWRPDFEDWYEEAADRVLQGNPEATPPASHIAIMNSEAHSLHQLVLDLLFHPPEDDFDEDIDDDLDDDLARELFGDDDVKGPRADGGDGTDGGYAGAVGNTGGKGSRRSTGPR